MSELRDFTPLFTIEGRCRICNQLRTLAGRDVHSEIHLARGEATVDVRYLKAGRMERVIPMPVSAVDMKLPKDFYRRADPKLRRIVRAALKKAKIAP